MTINALSLPSGSISNVFQESLRRADYGVGNVGPVTCYIGPEPLYPNAKKARELIYKAFWQRGLCCSYPDYWLTKEEKRKHEKPDIAWLAHYEVVGSIRRADALIVN